MKSKKDSRLCKGSGLRIRVKRADVTGLVSRLVCKYCGRSIRALQDYTNRRLTYVLNAHQPTEPSGERYPLGYMQGRGAV
jgi:hypothetical protein